MITASLKVFGSCEIEGFPSYRHTSLTTKNLVLRAPRQEDHQEWCDIRRNNRDHLQPVEPTWADDWDSDEASALRLREHKTQWQQDNCYRFLIFDRYGEQIIGAINVNNVVRGSAQFASLGYWIDKNHEGQERMSEAMDATLAFCFDALKLERVHAATLLENTRSQQVLERFGFEKEGFAPKYLKINNKRQDHILYGLNY